MLSCTKCTHYLFCKSETNQAWTSSWRTLQLFSHKDSWQSGRAKCANWVGDELRQGRWFPNRRWIGLRPCNDHSHKLFNSADINSTEHIDFITKTFLLQNLDKHFLKIETNMFWWIGLRPCNDHSHKLCCYQLDCTFSPYMCVLDHVAHVYVSHGVIDLAMITVKNPPYSADIKTHRS